MTAAIIPWIADVLLLLGTVIITIGVYGIYRMEDVYLRLHSVSLIGFIGANPILIGAALQSDPKIVSRVVLIVAFLLLTTAVSAHAIAYSVAKKRQGTKGRR